MVFQTITDKHGNSFPLDDGKTRELSFWLCQKDPCSYARMKIHRKD